MCLYMYLTNGMLNLVCNKQSVSTNLHSQNVILKLLNYKIIQIVILAKQFSCMDTKEIIYRSLK